MNVSLEAEGEVGASPGGCHSGSVPETDVEFEAFFSATYSWVVGFLAISLRDASSAEDAAQEAYARAYERWAEVGAMPRPDLWVTRVAWRVARDRWRRRVREVPLGAAGQDPGQEPILGVILRWSLDRLSPRQRAVLVLHHGERLDLDTVAGILGLRRNTVRTHLDRARLNLRQMLTETHDGQ